MGKPLIELKDIYKIYHMGDEEVRANDGISLTISEGEFVAIVGKSGSGKSTLMNRSVYSCGFGVNMIASSRSNNIQRP